LTSKTPSLVQKSATYLTFERIYYKCSVHICTF